ncbi:MAG: N-methylhydantoinase [Solirubrobacteraceae bacterium]|jgi:N-methylhydantoinase B|nr:N-methylhydantoinase [Solirubrobacteraceae bacterium]
MSLATQPAPPAGRVDAVTLEVIRHGLVAGAEQMATSIERSAHSQVIREMLDYSTAIFAIDGGIVAQSTRIPMHLNSMTRALRTLLRDHFPIEQWDEGDVFCTNDPYSGGQHLPDIQTFSAVFHDGHAVAITGTLGHHLDVGGRAAASYGADATEIYQEGFRIPPSRIVRRGVMNELFLPLFEANIRVPRQTVADVRSQIAALSIGATDVLRLVGRYGTDTVLAATAELVASSERRMRANIATLPEGTFTAEDIVDGDGLDDEPLPIRVAVTRDGDTLVVDFTGTAQAARGPINCPIASTESAVYYAVTAILDPGIPPNDGTYRPIRVHAPEGTVLNPQMPSPVVGRNVFTHRVANVVMAALGQALPDRAVAAYYGNSNVHVFSAYDDEGRANVQFEIEVGGWGGRPGLDGPDCLSAGIHNLANNPVELVENGFPLRVLRYGLRPDSGGPGRFRGGLGAERTVELLADCEFGAQFDRIKYPAPGLHGGLPGATGRLAVQRDGVEEDLPGKASGIRLRKGDVVTVLTQGGGGLGDPAERDRSALEQDIALGKVTLDAARRDYGYSTEDGR